MLTNQESPWLNRYQIHDIQCNIKSMMLNNQESPRLNRYQIHDIKSIGLTNIKSMIFTKCSEQWSPNIKCMTSTIYSSVDPWSKRYQVHDIIKHWSNEYQVRDIHQVLRVMVSQHQVHDATNTQMWIPNPLVSKTQRISTLWYPTKHINVNYHNPHTNQS